MIATLAKKIRRSITKTDAGELCVTLLPPSTIEIGIKGGKASDRLTIDAIEAWGVFSTRGTALPPADTAPPANPANPVDSEVQETQEVQVNANAIEALKNLKSQLSVTSFSIDPAINAGVHKQIAQIVDETLGKL